MRCLAKPTVATKGACARSAVALPVRRAAVVARDSKEDAVKALENFASGARAQLKEPPVTTVPVTPLAAKSVEQSMGGSVDGQGLLQLDKDTFWPYLEQQKDTLVVVDFYTDWCGPCKLIYPELVKLSQERTDVRFVKVNCNKSNKELGMQLQIKVAPTFHLYRNKVKVADMTGAKMDKLIALINEQQPAPQ